MPLASANLRPHELPVQSCHQRMPAVRGSMPPPACGSGYPYPLPVSRPQYPIPISRPQCRPPFQYGEQCFRPATGEQFFRPQPLPEHRLPFHYASFVEPTLRFQCRPPVAPSFELSRPSYATNTGSCVFPSIRQLSVLPQCPQPQHLPQTTEFNVPVVSVGFDRMQLLSESLSHKQAGLEQATESCTISTPVQSHSQPVFPNSGKSLDIVSQKTCENRSNSDRSSAGTYSRQNDEHRTERPSRRTQRRRSRTPVHSVKSRRSRELCSSSSLHREDDRDSRKQRGSMHENR